MTRNQNEIRGLLAGPEIADRFEQRTLRDFYYVLFRHKRKIVFAFVAIVTVVALRTFLAPQTFRSDAKLMVRLGRESIALDPTATTGPHISAGQDRQTEIKSELEVLSSQELVEKVVDIVGAARLLGLSGQAEGGRASATASDGLDGVRVTRDATKESPDLHGPAGLRGAAVLSVLRNLQIDVVQHTNVITVSFESHSPQVAQEVVKELIQCYLDKHIAVHRTPGSYEFFSRQTDELATKLARTEDELRKRKQESGIASLDEQRLALVARIKALQEEAERTRANIAASKARIETLRSTLADLPETIVTNRTTGLPDTAAAGMRRRLYDLQLKEQELLSKYREESPLVADVRLQMAEARKILAQQSEPLSQVTTGLNIARQQTEIALLTEKATLSSLEAKAETVETQLASAQTELTDLINSEIPIAELERRKEIQEALYRKYADNLEQTRIDQALEMDKISNIRVVQPATLPTSPLGRSKSLDLAIGLVLAVLGSIGIAFVSEYFDHTIKTPADVEERLQLPTLASIPLVASGKASLEPRGRKEDVLLPAVAPEADRKDRTRLVDLPSDVKASYETLRDSLVHAGENGNPAKLLAVTSCTPGEGVSTVAANLACALAGLADGKVLLIDADRRRPAGHRTFRVNRSAVSTDRDMPAGADVAALVRASPINSSTVVSASAYGAALPDNLSASQFRDLIGFLKKEYSFVVFDTPALSEVSSTVPLAAVSDGVILVVEAERVRWEVARRANERLARVHANVMGVVLNKRRFVIPEWLYRTL